MRDNERVRRIAVWLFVVVAFSSGGAVPDATLSALPGTLRITVNEGGRMQSFALAGGRMTPAPQACAWAAEPEAVAPDGTLQAVASPRRETHLQTPYDVFILRGDSRRLILRKHDDFIASLAWSPDSRYLAVLAVRERIGKSPLALLAALAGHPVQHQAFRAEIYTRDGQLVATTPYVRGFTGALARVCWTS